MEEFIGLYVWDALSQSSRAIFPIRLREAAVVMASSDPPLNLKIVRGDKSECNCALAPALTEHESASKGPRYQPLLSRWRWQKIAAVICVEKEMAKPSRDSSSSALTLRASSSSSSSSRYSSSFLVFSFTPSHQHFAFTNAFIQSDLRLSTIDYCSGAT